MIIGLTGGIAAGKSESAKYFESLGACAIDADVIAHELTAKGMPALDELSKSFGGSILLSSGDLNRKKLADIIFSDEKAKLRIEKIIHSHIISRINEIISQNIMRSNIVIDAPLLFEVGLDRICDKSAVVRVSYNIQVERLVLRDKLNADQAKRRISSQMPMEKKVELADFVIDNSGSKENLKKRVKDLYKLLTSEVKII
ncbi:dephospho-CoA kinase [Candidatus Endomicrobiellum trichonymphae]|uniref:Dephospho-CoA kinase n=1 Tax=Endomicrobium trichonymphae TaxID=1408204 RepID=B1GZ15_ENDTX|nr:dephospho-CoA kinase [Candidatus Endomicrobium trichonymphae]BAG13497.1 dephospho-CoA kinase [Candidatus Endomicrobium trichonymphae]